MAEKKYTVTLRSVGNPDRGQDPTRPVYGVKNETAMVDSFEEASNACRKYIGENGLGGGNWAGGAVFEDGKLVAYISYNGRIWTDEKDFPPGIRE